MSTSLTDTQNSYLREVLIVGGAPHVDLMGGEEARTVQTLLDAMNAGLMKYIEFQEGLYKIARFVPTEALLVALRELSAEAG